MGAERSMERGVVTWKERSVRLAVVLVGLALWFLTQSLIGSRELPESAQDAGKALTRGDGLLALTGPIHRLLLENARWADALLVVSSAVIDLLALFLIGSALLGRSLRPFLGLILLFSLRQLCQALMALPAPEGMIWRDPGFPSLLVTYGVANDFFFSGHTAIAVYGATEVARLGGRFALAIATLIALFEATTVIVLRAHYTMDVFTGVLAALFVSFVVGRLAPRCDRWIARLVRVSSWSLFSGRGIP